MPRVLSVVTLGLVIALAAVLSLGAAPPAPTGASSSFSVTSVESAPPGGALPAVPPQGPAPVTGTLFPFSFVTAADPNCGLTQIRGRLEDSIGRPVPGLAVRILSSDGRFSQLTPLSDAGGNWSMTLANSARSGLWFAWVDRNNLRVSDSVNVLTNGPDNCQPGSKGVQLVSLLFRQGPNAPVPGPSNPARPPLPIDSTLRYPFGAVTDVRPNCQTTNISGVVLDALRNGINNVKVRLRSLDGRTQREFVTVNRGNFGFNLGAAPIAGQWTAWIEEGGRRESTEIDMLTNGPDRCQPGSGGIQIIELRFQRR